MAKYRIGYLFVAIVLALTFGFSLVPASHASALDTMPTSCTLLTGGNDLQNWDWPSWVSKVGGTGNAGGAGWFDPNTTSYVFLGGWPFSAPVAGQTTDVIFVAPNNQAKLVVYKDSSGRMSVKSSDNGSVYSIKIIGRLPGISYSFDHQAAANTTSASFAIQSFTVATAGHGSTAACYNGSNNLVYDTTYSASWTTYGNNGYPSLAWSSGSDSATSGTSNANCGTLDVSCYAANLYNGVTNSIVAAFQAFTTGLYVLFVPSGTQISDDFNTFHTTLYNKLGFLTWPFSFVTNMFTAITTPTTTCCLIGAGTFMGATFPGIDLAFVSTNLPALWSFAQSAIKGLTVLMLFFMLRSKFMEITSK